MRQGLQTTPSPVSGGTQTTPRSIDATVRTACNQVQARWGQPTMLFDDHCWYAGGCSRLIVGAELQGAYPPKLIIEASTDRLPYQHRSRAEEDLEQLALRLCTLLRIEVTVMDPWHDPVYAHCNEGDD
jgi:hypothetical protein